MKTKYKESYKKESLFRLSEGLKPFRFSKSEAVIDLFHHDLLLVVKQLHEDGWVSKTPSRFHYSYYERFYPNQETLTFFEDEEY